MAASYTVKITCRICGTENTITNTTEATGGDNDTLQPNRIKKCQRCGNPFNFKFSSIKLVHSAGVGASNAAVTHSIVNGAITSTVAAS
jgi:phosphomevalonate kinase